MKITKKNLKRIIKEEKTRLLEQQVDPAASARTESQYGRTESGNPQSYKDFVERLDQIFRMTEDLSMDYVDSNWLADGDHASVASNVDNLFKDADNLSMTATSLAQSMGEI